MNKDNHTRLLTDAISPVLLVGGGRDSVTIVTAEEYQWALESGGEVEASVRVAFASGALSKVTDHSTVQVFSLDGICSSSS